MIKFFTKYFYLTIVAAFTFGISAGYFLFQERGDFNIVENIHPFREKENEYSFINPLLFYDVPNSINRPEYSDLRTKVQKEITKFNDTNSGGKISFYYRNLNLGQWMGINENENYTPSSLLKVVVMMAYFKEAESKPSLLSERIIFSKDIKGLMGSIPYDHGTELELGKSYSVSELIDRMIVDSDNGATYALISKINEPSLNNIYNILGLKNPANSGRDYTISVQDYAPFFRVIYNATYLNRAMSEKALALLSKTNFHDGIAAGVPRSIKVSHKYGESVLTKNDEGIDFVELHDCGIIYHPNNPYLLCIMTRGDNLQNLSTAIKEISEVVFTYTSK